MTRFVLSPRAQSDLDEIWDYTAKNWGTEQAALYLRQLETAIKSVAKAPGLGRSCDDIRMGYRKYPAGSHVIFFRLTGAGIEVIRILHRHMDFDRHV
ncbi:MAG: type II toxin-antitoxin system RelE/ParE family toxin [Beijerinckiaceae bacterium]|nr:type II toxin-antitoxin system RelE/ParE family toxin [Beijerinckiaceae bacterium]